MSAEIIKSNIRELERVCTERMKESVRKREQSIQIEHEVNEIENKIENLKEYLLSEYGEEFFYEY